MVGNIKTKDIITGVLAILLVPLLAIWNGCWINLKNKKKGWNLIAHIAGLVIRVVLLALIVVNWWFCLDFLILLVLVWAAFSWPLWDLLINIMMGNPLLYIGNTSVIDRFFKKYLTIYWIVKIIILILPIVYWLWLLKN